jgi:hypothetical protein
MVGTETFDITGPAARADWGSRSNSKKSPAEMLAHIRLVCTLSPRTRQVFPQAGLGLCSHDYEKSVSTPGKLGSYYLSFSKNVKEASRSS